MQNHKLVLPEHLNHYGFLFGGYMLMWKDEVAWIAASLDHPGFRFVTVAMDEVEFRKSVRLGTILQFEVTPERKGRTSVTYSVEVTKEDLESGQKEVVFTTGVTLVRVDPDGNKLALDAPA